MGGTARRQPVGALAVASVLLLLAAPASAIILHTDGVPASKPPNAVVGQWVTNGSAVAIGPNHIITSRHQGYGTGDSVWFDNVEYRIGEIRTPNQDDLENADLRVARIWTLDGRPANLTDYVGLYTLRDEFNKSLVLGGFGKGRGAELKTPLDVTYGYRWSGNNNQTQRWGANKVLGIQNDFVSGLYTTDTITLDFDDVGVGGWVANEAAAAQWDSGGGWFIFDQSSQQWKVAALTIAAEHATESETWFRNDVTGLPDPDRNWGVRISSYAGWIEDHSAQWVVPPGDANLDGMVDIGDLGILGQHYGTMSGMTWTDADFNRDGAVDIGDLGVLGFHYGTGLEGDAGGASPDWAGMPLPAAGAEPAGVPEPAAALLIAAGAVAIVRRRKAG